MPYVQLSDGRVGVVGTNDMAGFEKDVKRLGLTYSIISHDEYTLKMMTQTLTPEQVYYHIGGKKNFEDK